MSGVAPYALDPLTGPCARCGEPFSKHPGAFCPDGVGGDGMVNVMDAPTFVPATETATEVRLEYPDGSKRTVYVDADDAESAEAAAIRDEPPGTIPHALTATADFEAYRARREADRAAADAAYISWRKATLPGAAPGDAPGYVARNGETRAYVQPRGRGEYEFGLIVDRRLDKVGVATTLTLAKDHAFTLIQSKTEKEVPMSTATAVEKKAKAPAVDTAALRASLVAAIEEAVPGATRAWNKTSRYETFYVDGNAFGLVFKEGARTVSVKIPGQLREIKVSEAAAFTKTEYGLTRSLSKKGDVRVVAKVFATAAEAAKKKAEA